MTAAILLAKHGKRVALLEKSRHIAPLLTRFRRGDVWCDPGFHYTGGFQEKSFLPVLLHYLGINDDIIPIPMNPECFDIISLGEQLPFRMPYGLDRLQDYLASRFQRSLPAIGHYVEMLKQMNRITALENCHTGFGTIPGRFERHLSLKAFLSKYNAEQGLIDLLDCHGHILYGVPGDEIPIVVHSYIMGSFFASSQTIMRGGDAFVHGFKRALQSLGIDIYTGESVKSLVMNESKQVRALDTVSGRRIECDCCISTVHPFILASLLPEAGLKPAFRNRLTNFTNTYAPYVIFYDIKNPPEPFQRHNHYIVPDMNGSGIYSHSLALMGAVQEAESDGRRSLTAIRPVSPKSFAPYFKEKFATETETYKALCDSLSGEITDSVTSLFPDLKGAVQEVERASPVTYHRYTGTPDGCIYGIKQTVKQASLHALTSVRNLYLAGQSVIPGLMGGMVSSILAVTKIIDPELFWSDFRRCH